MKKVISIMALLALPSVALAQYGGGGSSGGGLSGISGLVTSAKVIVNDATVVVAGIALLVFFWGLTRYILKIGGDAKAASEGRQLMIWGTIALFVMVSVWGLVHFIGNEIFPGLDNSAPPIPTFSQ